MSPLKGSDSSSSTKWSAGDLAHLIPTASHERFLIKASFKKPLAFTPRLTVDGKPVEGFKTDAHGRFWRFDAPSLSANTTYALRLTDPGGAPLCDAWPLKTFPAPSASPERLRILAYTCAGGCDGPAWNGKTFFLDMSARRRLLARGMSCQPDVVIANGDHIYWDLVTYLNKPFVSLGGTLATGDLPFPSAFRGVDSKPSQLIGMDEFLKPTEKNGFSVIDVTPDKVTYTMFMWRPPQRAEEIDTMEPTFTYEVPRRK